MNNIKVTVFDTFLYLIPGITLILVIAASFFSLDSVHQYIQEITVQELGLFLFLGYVTGFLMDSVSSVIFLGVTQRAMDRALGSQSYAKLYAVSVFKQAETQPKIDQLNAMSGLARNFAVCLGFLFIFHFLSDSLDPFSGLIFANWCGYIGVPLLAGFLIYKSFVFRRWAHKILYHTWLATASTDGEPKTS